MFGSRSRCPRAHRRPCSTASPYTPSLRCLRRFCISRSLPQPNGSASASRSNSDTPGGVAGRRSELCPKNRDRAAVRVSGLPTGDRRRLRPRRSQEGFTPRIASASDDMVVVQALVAAGIGVTTLPGLALQAAADPTSTRPNNELPPPDLRRDPRRAAGPALHYRIDPSHPRFRPIGGADSQRVSSGRAPLFPAASSETPRVGGLSCSHQDSGRHVS